MFKLGLMGCGTVADYGHIPAIRNTPQLELSAIYEPDPTRTAELQKKHNVRILTDLEGFFHAGIDAVVVTSPAPAHYENVVEAARFGKLIQGG